jgi:hypothetical protein
MEEKLSMLMYILGNVFVTDQPAKWTKIIPSPVVILTVFE